MAQTSGGLPGATLRRVVEHINSNVHRGPRLAELSALAHLSVFHFARLFKLSTGLPPAVARGVGFRTASHFTSAFQRATGLTPSAYRAQRASVLTDSC
ncbi:MAG: helix-turn-helix transcriptional regulator [Candidatus Rokuibacteriota bacterium]|nr:MAG: helix-turn-helix transcriptional regulator [Candidatus Rokubacteria bacterium]